MPATANYRKRLEQIHRIASTEDDIYNRLAQCWKLSATGAVCPLCGKTNTEDGVHQDCIDRDKTWASR